MNPKALIFIYLFSASFCSIAQVIQYDTLYQVSYENGIKDSIIIIKKKVIYNEKIYLIDSSSNNHCSYDLFLCPFYKAISPPSTSFSSTEITNKNTVLSNNGKSIGSHIYYQGKTFDLRIGVVFNQRKIKLQSDRMRYTKETTTKFVNDTLDIYYSVSSQNDTTYFYVLDQHQENIEVSKSTREITNTILNVYFLEFALQAGYKIKHHKLSINFYAGPNINFLVMKKGTGLNDKGEVQLAQNVSIASPSVDAQLNVQVCQQFSQKTQWYIEPYFQKYLFSFNNHPPSFYIKDCFGVRAGLKFSL